MKENMMENRLQNLLWTVSEDYNCDVKINPADLQKSAEIAFYNMVLQGAFQKYFDADFFETYIKENTIWSRTFCSYPDFQTLYRQCSFLKNLCREKRN